MSALTEVEWETIHDRKELLLNFLVEEVNGRPCARLDQYRFTAKAFVQFCRDMDNHGNQIMNSNAKPLSEDESFLVDEIAKKIKVQGLNLRGMLQSLQMESRIEEICHIFARLVLAHIDDKSCNGIVTEFIAAQFKIRAKQCPEEV